MSQGAIVAIGAAIPGLPFVAVAIVGLVLSLLRRTSFPRAARWARLGFASLLLHSLLDQYSVVYSAFDGPPSASLHLLVAMTAIMYFLKLLGLIALVVAVFAERAPARIAVPGNPKPSP